MVSLGESKLELIREKLEEIHNEETVIHDVKLREIRKELEKIKGEDIEGFEEGLIKLRGELEELRESPTILEIFGVERRERSHSHFLGWLFNPKGSHGLGISVLDQFLRVVARKYKRPYKDTNLKEVIVELEKSGIESIADILITGSEFICVIENKIKSGEGYEQTNRLYNDFSKKNVEKFFVFLTPYEEKPKNENFVKLSYHDIKKIVEDVVKNVKIDEVTAFIVNEYLKNLKVNILGEFKGFGKKSELYYKNLDIFDELNNAWNENLNAFYTSLAERFEKEKWFKSGEWKVDTHSGKYLSWYKNSWQNKEGKGSFFYLGINKDRSKDATLEFSVYLENIKNRSEFRYFFMQLSLVRELEKDEKIELVGSDATLIRTFLPLKFGDKSLVDSTLAKLGNIVEKVIPAIDETISKIKIN